MSHPAENQKVWEGIYQSGHEQRAPWDSVVSFVYRNKPDVQNQQLKILEVGCGTGSNLRFFAHEGFQVAGVDFSGKAIAAAQLYFDTNNLDGDLRVGSFDDLPFEDGAFDFVVDRAAMTCAGQSVQTKAFAEIHRVLKNGGKFLYTPYAKTHASCVGGEAGEDGLTQNIQAGTLQNVGSICFVDQGDIEKFFPDNQWNLLSLEYETSENMVQDKKDSLHASWRVIVEKK